MFHLYPVTLNGLEKEFRAVKFLRSVKLIEQIVNGPEFKEWFLKQKFTQLSDLKFKDNEALLDQLLVTVKFTYSVRQRPWYKRYSSVIGYTIGSDIVTYKDTYDRMSVADFCSHLTHELTHCDPINFSHSVKYSKERELSLPYAIGDYVLKSANAILSK
jgi:hypothetical protein